jgi:hypothetical protein
MNTSAPSGAAAGQTVGHAHVHVVPRRRGDVDDPRGGVRRVILNSAGLLERPVSDAVAGEKLLSLLEESARSSTYKPALLLALIDLGHEWLGADSHPVRVLAERVTELYWPQTLAYPTTGNVLRQNQATGQAAIGSATLAFREHHATASRALPAVAREDETSSTLVTRVEERLAE